MYADYKLAYKMVMRESYSKIKEMKQHWAANNNIFYFDLSFFAEVYVSLVMLQDVH